jgi:hypothetical protein
MILAVELADEIVGAVGEIAVILLGRPPTEGGPGAIKAGDEVFVGYLYFKADGSVALTGREPGDDSCVFGAGSFEVLGRIYRICACHENGSCRSVMPSEDDMTAPVFAAK